MTLHFDVMDSSVEYRQQQVAHDIRAAQQSMFWQNVRLGTGAFLIRIGERLGQEGDCLERAVREPRSQDVQPRQVAA